MASLPDAFFALARDQLASLPHAWSGPEPDGKRVLELPSASETGFTVRVECESYGIHVYADGWHGAPFECGPSTATTEATAENCLGFVRTLLCTDSSLEVSYAGAKPIRWVLSYATDAGTAREEMGLLVYNYFASRSKRILQNNHLPPRYLEPEGEA